MGTTVYAERFCDLCFVKIERGINGPMTCAACPPILKGREMCQKCGVLHFRKKHPSLWMQIVIPSMKANRQK